MLFRNAALKLIAPLYIISVRGWQCYGIVCGRWRYRRLYPISIENPETGNFGEKPVKA
jgi:hypothetical protein